MCKFLKIPVLIIISKKLHHFESQSVADHDDLGRHLSRELLTAASNQLLEKSIERRVLESKATHFQILIFSNKRDYEWKSIENVAQTNVFIETILDRNGSKIDAACVIDIFNFKDI